MYWIYDYPSWLVGPLFVAVFIAVTSMAILLSRRTVHAWIHRHERANEMIGLALSGFFVLFGLLLGLLAVATYQNFAACGDDVDKEASSLAALYRDFGAYPAPINARLQAGLRDYTRYVIDVSWPQQREGVIPPGGTARITALAATLYAFEPSTKGQEILHAESLRQFNDLVSIRRARIAAVRTGLPAVLWWVVAFGALINILLIALQDMEIHVHLILGAALTSFLAAVVFLTAALDHPFRGEVSIGPEALEIVYDQLMATPANPSHPP
jgi:hypothetical protein